MNLQNIASHTIDVDLLPWTPRTLDAGCRDFDFTRGIFNLRPNGTILALDPDPEMMGPPADLRGVYFRRVALVGKPRETSGYFMGSTGHGNFLSELPQYYDMRKLDVMCISICQLGVPWDLVKLDIEGAEFDVLNEWPGPIARQISVEFHDWDKPDIRDGTYYSELFARLATFGYRVVQHELSIQGTGRGHWDTLIVLDDEKRTAGG